MVEKFVLKIYFLHSFNLDKKIFLDKCLSMGRFAQINSKFKQKPFFKVKFLLLGKFYFYKTKRVRYNDDKFNIWKNEFKRMQNIQKMRTNSKRMLCKKKSFYYYVDCIENVIYLVHSTSTLCIFFWIMFPLTFK